MRGGKSDLGDHENGDQDHVELVGSQRFWLVQRAKQGQQERVGVRSRERVLKKILVACERQLRSPRSREAETWLLFGPNSS